MKILFLTKNIEKNEFKFIWRPLIKISSNIFKLENISECIDSNS